MESEPNRLIAQGFLLNEQLGYLIRSPTLFSSWTTYLAQNIPKVC